MPYLPAVVGSVMTGLSAPCQIGALPERITDRVGRFRRIPGAADTRCVSDTYTLPAMLHTSSTIVV
jgi:hypothetical protein